MKPSLTSTGLPVEEMDTLKRFFLSCTVPIVYQSEADAQVFGTGTFVEYQGRPFLISAGHVFDRVDANRLGVPERSGRDVDIWHFGYCTVHHPRNTDEFDVAIVQLQDDEFISRARSGWHFLNEGNIAPSNATFDHYVVAGYPDETVEFVDGVLRPTELTQLYTGIYDGEIEGSRTEYDLFLRYGREAKTAFGAVKETPQLGGASGAAVYGRASRAEGVWAPESILSVVGIQVSSLHSKYVRVKKWQLVQQILSFVVSSQP